MWQVQSLRYDRVIAWIRLKAVDDLTMRPQNLILKLEMFTYNNCNVILLMWNKSHKRTHAQYRTDIYIK